MDFQRVTEKLLGCFEQDNVRYALIGGIALGLWGVHRSTVDIDFLVHRDDLEKIDRIMETLGYERHFHSENVSQYLSPLVVFGEVDFLHAFRDASVGMLARAEKREIFGHGLKIRVARPEDLIGLKIQAMANDPLRRTGDLADIESLLDLQGSSVDWRLIEDYFILFEEQELLAALREKYYG